MGAVKGEYRKTNLGRIPEEWGVQILSDLCDFSTGKNIKQSEASPNYKIPCVRYGELYHLYSEVIYEVVNKTNLDQNQLKFSLGNEILLPSAGEDPLDIGSASALTIANVAIGRTINILRPKKDNLYSQIFLSYYINQKLRKKIASLAKGVSISNVYNSDLKQLELVLPPLPEQKKIADILSTWDKAIETTQALLQKLELRKKGLMQQLLTGKKRLPGFSGEWEEVELQNSVKQELRPKDKPSKPYLALGLRSHGKGIFHKPNFDPASIMMTTLYEVLENDLVVNITFAWEHAIAVAAKVDEGGLVSHRFPTYSFLEKISYSQFFKYFFLQKRFKYLLGMISPGGAGRNRVMSKKDFLKIKVVVPSYKEQIAIAQVLSKADEEISQTQNYLDSLQTQKKGLMQQLLTGQKRVKV